MFIQWWFRLTHPPLFPTASTVQKRALEEIRAVFDAEMAQITYIPFCKQIGGIYMAESILGTNNELIRKLCLREEDSEQEIDGPPDGNSTHRRNPSQG